MFCIVFECQKKWLILDSVCVCGYVRGQAEKEFKVEVEAIGRVRHKNLVRLLGYCAEGAHRYIVLPLFPLVKLLMLSSRKCAAIAVQRERSLLNVFHLY